MVGTGLSMHMMVHLTKARKLILSPTMIIIILYSYNCWGECRLIDFFADKKIN